MAKQLKASEVKEIYRRYCLLEDDITTIAADFNISFHLVSKIGTGERHSLITGQQRRTGRRQILKLPSNIVELYEMNSLDTLALEFECSRYLVRSELMRRGAIIRPVSRAERATKRAYNRKGRIDYGNFHF